MTLTPLKPNHVLVESLGVANEQKSYPSGKSQSLT